MIHNYQQFNFDLFIDFLINDKEVNISFLNIIIILTIIHIIPFYSKFSSSVILINENGKTACNGFSLLVRKIFTLIT